jgi:acyl dehydratase
MNKKRFSPAGQAAFARLSGDYNPIHMDDVVARRLLFGASFIHGIDALLWCLDLLCHFRDEANQRLLEVKAISKTR